MSDPFIDGNIQQNTPYFLELQSVCVDKRAILTAALQNKRKYRTQQECVSAGQHLKMKVGHISGLGTAWIDHDHAPLVIPFDLVETGSRIPKSMRHPRIAAEHDQQVAMLHILGGMTILRAEQVAIDPEVAGLFLRECIRVVR